jgi:hypothetical protein
MVILRLNGTMQDLRVAAGTVTGSRHEAFGWALIALASSDAGEYWDYAARRT